MSVAKTKLYYLENFLSHWQIIPGLFHFDFPVRFCMEHHLAHQGLSTFRDVLFLQDTMIIDLLIFFQVQILILQCSVNSYSGVMSEALFFIPGKVQPVIDASRFLLLSSQSGTMDQFMSRPRFQVLAVHLVAAICLPLAEKVSQMFTDLDWHPTSKNTFHCMFVLFTIMIFVFLTFRIEGYYALSLSFHCV